MKRFPLALAGVLAFVGALLISSIPALAQNCSGQPSANTVCAGPPSGGAGFPGWRAVVTGDVTNNAVTNALLAQMAAGTIKCNPTAATANAADCVFSSGFVTLSPANGQGSGNWLAVDPFNNTIACGVSTSQCLQEALTAARTGGWGFEMNCGNVNAAGTVQPSITATATVTIGSWDRAYINMKPGCLITGSGLGTNSLMSIDSQENSHIYLNGSLNHGTGTGPVVLMKAVNPVPLTGNTAFSASEIRIHSAIPGTGGDGCVVDPTNGGFNGNVLSCDDPNGGARGLVILNPGGPSIAVEENLFIGQYMHGQTTATVQALQSTTNATNCRANKWLINRISPNGATDGFSSYCQSDTVIGTRISNEEGVVTNGYHFQTGSAGATVIGGAVSGAGSALVDAGTCNSFINVAGVTTSMCEAKIIGDSAAGGTLTLQSTSSGAPSGDAIVFRVAGAEQQRMISGHVLIGATASQTMGTAGSVNPYFQAYQTGAAASFGLIRQTTPGGGGAIIVGGSSRSTPSSGSYSALLSGDGLMNLAGVGDTGTNLNGQGASIALVADANWTGSSTPGRIVFNVTPSGGTGSGPVMTLNSASHVVYAGSGVAVSSGAGDCGTSPSIAGNDIVGRVTVGSSSNGGHCTVTFGVAYTTNAPVCVVNNETSTARPVYVQTAAVGSIVITASTTLTAADKLTYSCSGY